MKKTIKIQKEYVLSESYIDEDFNLHLLTPPNYQIDLPPTVWDNQILQTLFIGISIIAVGISIGYLITLI